MSSRRRVVVTGMGLVSALGHSPESVHGKLADGHEGLGPIELFETEEMSVRTAGEIAFEPEEHLGKGRNLRPLDRTAMLVIAAATQTLAVSGLPEDDTGSQLIGLVLGSMFGSVHSIAAFDRRALMAGPSYAKPLQFANSVINAAAGQTAIWHRLKGINSTIAGGTLAGLSAFGYAADLVRDGHIDAVLAGGAEELCTESFFGFLKAGHLAGSRNGSRACPVPFDAERNGFALAEGAALCSLEAEEPARKRGATVLAEILGHGSAFDPSRGREAFSAASAIARAAASALEDAGVTAEAIEVLSLSGNGSLPGDLHEALGLAEVFGERLSELPCLTVKAGLGESLGASGGFQTALLIEAVRRGSIPGIQRLKRRDAQIPLESLSAEVRRLSPWGDRPRLGLVHALGLDGGTVCLVVAVHPPSRGEASTEGGTS